MQCPTCSAGMKLIGGDSWWWCPRCGTLRNDEWSESPWVPAIVARCREFEEEINRDSRTVIGLRAAFARRGIREAIRPENER